MKIAGIIFVLFVLVSCSEGQIEEFAFRKTIEYDLVELCGIEEAECVAAVKDQVKGCMQKSNWRRYLEDQDNESELNRFTSKFYACIVDAEGNPYFEPNI